MNSDTFPGMIRSDYASTHPFAPAVLTLTSTTDTTVKFANTTGAAIVAVPLQGAILGSSTPSDPNANPAVLVGSGRPGAGYRGAPPYFNSGSFDGRPFTVTANFKAHLVCAAGGATVWTPKLWNGTSSTPGSNNAILATTGLSVPLSHTADLNCTIQATLMWDSNSITLGGEVWSVINCFDSTASAIITAVYNSRGAIATLSAGSTVAITNTPACLNFLTSVVNATTAPTSSATTLTELALSQI